MKDDNTQLHVYPPKRALKWSGISLWFNDFVLSLNIHVLKCTTAAIKYLKTILKRLSGERRNNAEIKRRNSFHYSHMDPFKRVQT